MDNKVKMSSSYRARQVITNIFVHVFLAVLSIIWVLPVVWVILKSLTPKSSIGVLPDSLTFDNYIKLFTDTTTLDFSKMFMNTFIIAIFSCLVSTVFVLCVSYCLSRLRFKARKLFMNMAMILGLFPGIMSIVAVYYIVKSLGLSEGPMIRVALVLVYSSGAGLGFYIAKGFFDTVPRALDEAAMIDGATKWEVFTKVTIPLSKPVIVFTVLTAFISPWVDFIAARVICKAESDYYTVSIGLWQMLSKDYIISWETRFAAGAVCISIPIALLFLYLQKFYVNGMGGAVKG